MTILGRTGDARGSADSARPGWRRRLGLDPVAGPGARRSPRPGTTLPAEPRWLHVITRWVLPLGWALLVFWFWVWASVGRYRHLNAGIDVQIFAQALWNLAHGHVPASSLIAPGFPLYADHVHPIIYLLTPIFWFTASPVPLLTVQAGCIAATTAIVLRECHRYLGLPGLLLGLAFPFSRGIQGGAMFDFHEVALGMPLLAVGCAAFLRGRYRTAFWLFLALFLVKEDTVFITFGLAAAFWLRGQRRLALWLAGASVVWGGLATKVIIPVLSPVHEYLHTRYGGGDPFTTQPLQHLEAAIGGPGQGVVTIAWLLGAVGFAAVRSPLLWAFLAPTAVRMITWKPEYWDLYHHYNLLPTVLLAFAAIDALRSEGARRRLVAYLITFAVAIGGLIWLRHHELAPAVGPCPRCAAAAKAVKIIPDDATVGCDPWFVAQLPASVRAQPLSPPDFTDNLGKPLKDDWLILDTVREGGSPGSSDLVLRKFQAGYTIVFQQDGFVVLHRQ